MDYEERVFMKTIRWGIIGCGDVTEVKSGPGFQKARGSELIAVMRRTGEKAKDYARRHNVPRWYDDADQLIGDPEVDAVYIATHPDTHKEYALRVARAGKPVYVEKPMGLNYQHGLEMVQGCARANVPLFVAYYRRALPKFLRVKKILESKRLGEIRAVEVLMRQQIKKRDTQDGGSWRVRPEISGGGHFPDVGSHALDLIDFLLGPIVEAQGMGANQSKTYRAEDIVWGHFKTHQGVAGVGTFLFNTYINDDWTTIHCEKGDLAYSVLDLNQPIVIRTKEGTETIAGDPPPTHVAQPLIQTVVDELLGIGTCPSTGESALRTDWVLARLAGTI